LAQQIAELNGFASARLIFAALIVDYLQRLGEFPSPHERHFWPNRSSNVYPPLEKQPECPKLS
jgi:hypothetical protein